MHWSGHELISMCMNIQQESDTFSSLVSCKLTSVLFFFSFFLEVLVVVVEFYLMSFLIKIIHTI